MPEITGTGDNWFISYHQEGCHDVLEVALPSNQRVRLAYVDGRDFVAFRVLNKLKDETEKWETIAGFKCCDLDGIASLFVKARDLALEEENKGGRNPRRWLWRMVFGERRDKRGTIDDMFERVGFADGAGRSGEQDRLPVPADGGGGGRDRQDGGAPPADGPGAT